MQDDQGFERFRRERNKRRMEGGPLRPLGQNASILREIEAAEQREVRNQRLTREVHEFFADATRTAATIVTQVAENAEQEVQQSVSQDMTEFLAETMRRVQEFVQLVRTSTPDGVAQQEINANMQNIVGQVLDEFRFAGDVSTAETHVGQDPFATDLAFELRNDDGPSDSDPPASIDSSGWDDGPDAPSPIEEHLVAELLADDQGNEDHDTGAGPLQGWFDGLKQDEASLKLTLKLLVRAEVMSKDQARAIYQAR